MRIDGARTWGSLQHRLPMQPQHTNWANGEQLAKPLANGDIAVLLFNRLGNATDIVLNFEDVGDTSRRCWDVRDIWAGQDLGRFQGTFAAESVPSHACRFLRLSAGAVCNVPPPPPPPAPPMPACPRGYTAGGRGFWHNTDPCNGA